MRARRATLRVTGQLALVLAAAGSTATLLNVAHAPSGGFVLKCYALGLAALATVGARPLRNLVPSLSLLAAGSLGLLVMLEVLHGGNRVMLLEVVGCAAVLPLLSIQIASVQRRMLVVTGAATLVVVASAAAGVQGLLLGQLVVAVGFAAAVALLAAQGLDASRERSERRAAQLRRTMLRERRLMQAREEMIANLSHDLRNPLAIAVGFAEMAEDDELPADERTHALSGLRRSLCEMTQLVENVLDGSADQAGALTTALEPVDLETLCTDALSATRVLLRNRPIEIGGEIEAGMLVLADRPRLARVLGNLLSNACKYTERGEIRLEALSVGGYAVLRVADSGRGIAPEAVPFIFDRFRRAHEGGGPAGVGLGLAIAHRLTERMGGTLDVETELGVGSTFTLTLPLLADEQSGAVAA